MPVQPDFPSHLKTQRLTEELASAQKKLEEYKDLFTKLNQNACEHCKESFQRIGVTGTGPVAARTSIVEMPSTSHSNGPTSVVPRIPFWNRILKRPRISLPKSFSRRHGPATPRVSADASRSRCDPNPQLIPASTPHADECIQAPYFVEFHDSTLQVKLEHVWTHTSGYSVKFSPNGKHLAVGVADYFMDSQKTYVYDVTIGGTIRSLLADRYAGRNVSSSFYLSFSSRDGRYLATGHSTGQTMIWQAGEKHVRNAFGAQDTYCVDFSPNGRFVVSGSFNRSGVRIWSMRDGSSVLLQDPDGEGVEYMAVKFSPDGKYVVASDLAGMLRLWNTRTAKLIRKWNAHRRTVWDVAFTPNGSGLVTASDDHTLKYWDLGPPGFGDAREVEVLKFVGHSDAVRSVAISSDGRWVVSGSYDCTTRIWDIADAALQCTLLGHEKGVMSVDFSATGDRVAVASRDGKVSVWSYSRD